MKNIQKNNKKHIIIIGAQRCGTTALLDYLSKYKNAVVAKKQRPEPKYFLKNSNYKNYLKIFQDTKIDKAKLLIEKSTSYIESIDAAKNIKNIKNIKILIILRNPVDRFISNFFFTKKNKYEALTLSQVINNFTERKFNKINFSVSPFNYYGRGIYYRYIDFWKKIYGKNCKIIVLENILKKEKKELKSLCLFLNLKFNPKIIFKKKNNIKYKVNMKLRKKLFQFYIKYNELLFKKYKVDIRNWIL